MKGRETFYRRHTVPVTSCSEVKYVLKRVSFGNLLESEEGMRMAVEIISWSICTKVCERSLPYFRGDESWYKLGPILSWRLIMKYILRPFSSLLLIEGLLSVTSESMCTKYWLTAYSSQDCLGKSVVRWTDRPDMSIAVDWDIQNQTKSQICMCRRSPLS